jgi:ABC-2 type transport system permease protein
LISRFEASPHFVVRNVLSSVDDIDPYLSRGLAWMALSIPAGYGQQVGNGRPAVVQVVADGSDANSTTVAMGYATTLIAGYGQELAAERAEPVRQAGGIEARIRVWFNPRLESRDFMLPGVIALLLLVVTTNLSSMAIVREKELGTLEQLNVTPLARWELVVGKLLPYALVGMVDVCLVTAVAVFWFQVPLKGSVALVLATSVVYLLCTLSLGLFISTISSTQQQAMMTTTFFFLTPMIYLSGFIFPIENMPDIIQPITYLIPLRYFLVILRGIFLKGVGLPTLGPQIGALLAWGSVMLVLAIARSRKRSA